MIELHEPGEDTLSGGDTLFIKGVVKDNKALSQLKLEIHEDFDGHAHLKKPGAAPFAWDSIINLSGKEHAFDLFIVLPEDITSGPYHLQLMALDLEGNEADFVARSLFLYNGIDGEVPVIEGLSTDPAEAGGVITLQRGQNFRLMATLKDNLDMDSLHIMLEEEATHSYVWKYETVLNGITYSLDETVPVQQAWPTGQYELIIRLRDKKGNWTQQVKDVLIIP